MKKKTTSVQNTPITPADVAKIARLATIPVTEDEKLSLAKGFNTTIEVVNRLFQVDVTGVSPMGHVTGVENVYREDEINHTRMFTQDQALSNAKRVYNGFFVANQSVDE